MSAPRTDRPFEILVVEDNPGDARLTLEALRESRAQVHISVARDGPEALACLQRSGEYANVPRPDLIFLDLNLPKKRGVEVLARIKSDVNLRHIPVIVFTTSGTEEDVRKIYSLHANCYVTKPADLDRFMKVIRFIGDFWLSIARLPRGEINEKHGR